MKTLTKISLFLFFIFLFKINLAQQLPYSNQYQINKFHLSPAFAGLHQNTELFMGFRQNWTRIQGAPECRMISINAPQTQNMGLGGTIINDKIGIFNHLHASLSYSYQVKIDRYMGLSFGLAAGLYNNRIDISGIKSATNADPQLVFMQDFHGTTFNVMPGVLFHYQTLYVGIAVPQAIGNKINYDPEKENYYTMSRHYLLHASYNYEINREFDVEPFVMLRTTERSPFAFEVAATGTYQDRVWLTVGYRKRNSILFSVGGAINDRLVANYTYELGSELYQYSGGTHEIGIGFLIKDGKSKHPSIFEDLPPSTNPEIDELKKQIQNNNCCEELEKEIEKLHEKIDSLHQQEPDKSEEIKEIEEKIKNIENEVDDIRLNSTENLEFEKAIVLKNIQFATNSSELKPSSYPALDNLVKHMKDHSEKKLMIVGHTDNVGDPAYNLKLSKERARAVKNYLVSKEIAPERIFVKGMGMKSPLTSNSTEAGRALNRRIEASFTK